MDDAVSMYEPHSFAELSGDAELMVVRYELVLVLVLVLVLLLPPGNAIVQAACAQLYAE